MSACASFSDSFLDYLAAIRGGVIGVAVSGGSDSLALLHLAHDASRKAGVSLRAASVNHRLRPEAGEECAFVGEVCAGLSIPHDVLVWEDHPRGNLQNEARKARFALLARWAKATSARAVLLGHTADDQAETVLMRIARGAGVDGLAGMAPEIARHDVSFLRPILHLRRAALRELLDAKGQRWVEDPSNRDDRFERVRARKLLADGAFEAEALLELAAQMQDVRSALEHDTARYLRHLVREDRGDYLLAWQDLAGLPREHRRRLLLAVMKRINGAVYPPRRSEQLHLLAALRQQTKATLHGCVFAFEGEDLRLSREPNAVAGLASAPDEIWDGRWQLEGPAAPGHEVRALGDAGLRQCPDWRATGLPRSSLLASPAIWRGETLIAAPLAGLSDGWCATLTRSGEGTA